MSEHFSLIPAAPEALRVRYNSIMENDHWSRDDWLKSYETGVWVFLIVVVAAFLGLILWMGYTIFL